MTSIRSLIFLWRRRGRRMRAWRLLLCFPPTLASCGTYWAKPGGTAAELDAEMTVCEAWAYKLFPLMLEQVQLTPAYTTPLSSVCEPQAHRVSCYPTGGIYVPPSHGSVDRNERARQYAVGACLTDAGWVAVQGRADAEAITGSARRR